MANPLRPETRSHRVRALPLEMLFIFVGVTAAFFVESYRDRSEAAARAVLLAGALDQDIGDSQRVQAALVAAIDDGLATSRRNTPRDRDYDARESRRTTLESPPSLDPPLRYRSG